MSNSTIRIKEKHFLNNVFTVDVIFKEADGSEEEAEVELPNLYDEKTDKLLEWYFEEYISKPYDDVKVKGAVSTIKVYGNDLFQHLFKGDTLPRYQNALQSSGPENISIEIVGDTAAFQAIYWESLWDIKQAHPLAALGTVFIRKNIKPVKIRATVNPSPTINLLIVTARPNEEADVNYRTIQRPLIDLIEKTSTPVKAHILRPGTYEAFIRHLDVNEKRGYYHIVHFDLHGSLLDFERYQYFQEEATNASAQLFKSSFGLKPLSEEDFNGSKKAFIFFESEEKGIAIPVDADQLADFLENRQIPICILNACQSAKQDNATHKTSLGQVLMKKGVQLVLAMRYSVSVSAARLMMEKLYEQLYKQEQPIEQAIADSRQELYRNKNRKASYNYDIELEDWLLPVVYENAKPVLQIRKHTPEEEEQHFLQQQLPDEVKQQLPYGFFGRDLDILKIEKNLLLRSNILLLQGMGGAGKTTLLKYLAAWWMRTGFIQKVFYFGYDIKAYTLNEILFHIAKEIYSRYEFGAFTAKLPAIQENNIVTALKTNNYVLILDNAESITGEKLAIPHTLSPDEQNKLQSFIAKLKGGQSPVIIGSRANEEWLKGGTFENNSYILRGLDRESASNFAHRILKDIGISAKTIINEPEFERLMKLLAGFPLALKAILPNLKNKTAKRILNELEEGIGDLDKGNIQQRTESIIKCIEYAHSNLSEEAQQLLLCLAPFQSVVNVDPDFINIYFEELKKEEVFQNYPFAQLENIIKEAVQNGFMQEANPDSSFQIMSLQPVFTFFLKNKLNKENQGLQLSLQNVFINYYYVLSKHFGQWINSKDPKEQQTGIFYTGYEYENLYQVLTASLKREEAILAIYNLIDNYLGKKQLLEKRIQVAELVHNHLKQYADIELNSDILYEYLGIKLKLATLYKNFKKYSLAKSINQQVLYLVDTNPYLSESDKFIKGKAYHNLGIVSQEQKDYGTAKDYYEKALALYIQLQDVHSQGGVYQNLGIVSQEQKDYGAAKDYYEKALAVFVQFRDVHSQGRVYQNLGYVLSEQKNYVAAKDYYKKALAIFVQFQDVYRQGNIYQNLGIVSREQEDYRAAKNYYEKALAIFVQFQDAHSQGKVYHNLGVISQEQEDYRTAKDYYEKALAIFVQFQDAHSQGQVYQNLGIISREQKEYEAAKEFYKKALAVYVQFQDVYRQGQVYQNLGVNSQEQKDFETAKEYYEKALAVFVQFQDAHSQGQVYQNLGIVSKGQKDYEAAKEFFEKALAVYVQFQDVHRQGRVYQNLGVVSQEQKDDRAAKEYYEKALFSYLKFPEDIHSIAGIIQIIYDFTVKTKDKPFGQTMIQKTLPYFEGEDESYLQNLLDDINKV